MIAPTERRRVVVPTVETLARIAADAYSEAALLGASMQHAVDLLEPLRSQARFATDAYRLGQAFDGAVGAVATDALLPVFTRVRDRYFDSVADGLARFAADVYATDEKAGREEWLRACAESLGELQRSVLAALAGRPPGAALEPWATRFADTAARMAVAQWDAVLPVVNDLLAEVRLEPAEASLLHVIVSEVNLYFMEDVAAAEHEAELARRLAPSEVRAGEALAEVRLDQGRGKEAEALLHEYLAKDPARGVLYVRLSECSLAEEDLDAAERRLLDGVRCAPHSSEVYSHLLVLYGRKQFFAQHEGRLDVLAAQATAIDPDSTYNVQTRLAHAYLANGLLDRAREILERARAAAPTRTYTYIGLARVAIEAKDYDTARRELERALELEPKSWDVADTYLEWCDATKDVAAAVEWARRGVEWRDGNRGRALAQLASRLADAGDETAALDTAAQAVAVAPADGSVIDRVVDVAAAAARRNDDDRVRAIFAPVVSAHGKAGEVAYERALASTAYSAERYADAAQGYRRVVERLPDSSTDRRELARSLRQVGDYDGALSELAACTALDSTDGRYDNDYALVFNERANRAYEEERYADAVPDYEEASRRLPDDAAIHSNLALALEAERRTGERATNLERALHELTRAAELGTPADYAVRQARVSRALEDVRAFGELVETPAQVPPIAVEFADNLVGIVDPSVDGGKALNESIPEMRVRLAERLGFDTPGLRLRPAALAPNGYRVLFDEVVVAPGTAVRDSLCVTGVDASAVRATVPAEHIVEGHDPVLGVPCVWVTAEWLHDDIAAAATTAVSFVLHHVEDVVQRNAGRFFGLDVAKSWVATMRGDSGDRSTDDDRVETWRFIAMARALRALTDDGVRLDVEVLDLIDGSLDRSTDDKRDAQRAAVDAVAAVRAQLADRLALGDATQVRLPASIHEVLVARDTLSVLDAQALVTELRPIVEANRDVAVVVGDRMPRAYLERLLADEFRTANGAKVSAVTESEVAAAPTHKVAAVS